MSYYTLSAKLEARIDAYLKDLHTANRKNVYLPMPPDLRRDLITAYLKQLGKDGLCLCNCADLCPIEKCGSMSRCSRRELEEALKS